MKPISDLVLAHAGRPALVIGGGESAPTQMKLAPAGTLVLSANQHGALLTKCDYIVACDNKPGRQYISPGGLIELRSLRVPIISPRENMCDFRIFKVPVNSSGCMAAWAAWVMGCSPILLAGMDLYTGKATYFHNPKAHSTGRFVPEDAHANKWRVLQRSLPNAMLRALGGPLVSVLGAYDPKEKPWDPSPREEITEQAQGLIAKLKSGEKVQVSKAELIIGLRRRMMVEVKA